ncbi:hypothetical protein A1O7_06825 [Cladophialophora yegresii CBS 114405]|uniref:BZIP domain-containing protein n=1 Tax=Cladophialophora yegresii CBS 114405 TaxID=1182544 RepID=W9VW82_9EURO|nr:uncharacterized protein A1O7_06825 [Cladophialophora yegresii CBS 114405]EXJ56481.1 hypothetical protein A1O7_06825 [Cladophialophora yegresii CBS 114405]
MSVPLVDNTLDGSLFDTSGMYFEEDMAQFDDFHLEEDFQHDSMPGSFSHAMSLAGSNSAEGSIFDDVITSPADQPVASTSTDSERSAQSHTKMRRRAQNRASQRAFRERKERHLRSLKATLETIGDKHRKLLESYSQQSEAVMKLKGRIAELNAQIAAYSTQPDRGPDRLDLSPNTGYQAGFDQFDAFSFSLKPSSNPNTMFWENQNQNPEPFRVNMLQLPACENLPGFEDLLNVP